MWTNKFVFYCLLAVVVSFLVHELAHWLMGEALGYEMRMTLNTAYPAEGKYEEDWHYTLISAVGPLTTLLEAVLFYFLIRKSSDRNLFPFLFMCFYLELLSGVMNFRHPNDLGRISRSFELGLFTLPVLFTGIQFMLFYKTIRRENYGRKFILITLLLIMVFSSVWILTNQKYGIIVI